MTKRERERLTALENILMTLGFTSEECDKLRRINSTLRRWHELECGINDGAIERDDATAKPYWVSEFGRRFPVADRETGALRRLAKIMRDVNGRRPEKPSFIDDLRDDLTAYIQTDPRGAALYILRPGDVPNGFEPESCYTRGVCVF